jgi:hypothetical protein
MSCSNSVSNSLINFFFFPRMVKSDLSCDYNEIMHRYCQCIAVRWGGQATLIQGIKEGSLLLLLVLAAKKWEVLIGCLLLEKMKKEDIRNGTKEQWNP